MDFKEIAAVSGKPGLFRILKPTRNGVVLESLDEKKEKTIISSNTKVSILKDISMYTVSAEGNKALGEILIETKKVFEGTLPVTSKSDDKALRSFFLKVLPDFDEEKVYISDIKKLVIWYGIIYAQCPDVLVSQVEEPESAETEKTEDKSIDEAETKAEEAPVVKKATAKKTAEPNSGASDTPEVKEPKAKKAKV